MEKNLRHMFTSRKRVLRSSNFFSEFLFAFNRWRRNLVCIDLISTSLNEILVGSSSESSFFVGRNSRPAVLGDNVDVLSSRPSGGGGVVDFGSGVLDSMRRLLLPS